MISSNMLQQFYIQNFAVSYRRHLQAHMVKCTLCQGECNLVILLFLYTHEKCEASKANIAKQARMYAALKKRSGVVLKGLCIWNPNGTKQNRRCVCFLQSTFSTTQRKCYYC